MRIPGQSPQPCSDGFHDSCAYCDGIIRDEPNHDLCQNTCGAKEFNGCAAPCGCGCDKPLTRNEVMSLRAMLQAVRR